MDPDDRNGWGPGLEYLEGMARYTGYVYALTDLVKAMTDYLDVADTVVLTISDVVDITGGLIDQAGIGGLTLPAR
jgi:hypothetical protein